MSVLPRASFSDDSMIIKKPLPKSLLLRDYLLDDMSSCSSNGFRSYPRRRQCCTTVRFLLEMDLNKRSKLPQKQPFLENKNKMKSKSKHKQSSMLQRASNIMIKAFKHFPFAGFWKKSNHHNKDVKMLKSFGDLIKETPSSPSRLSTAVTNTTMSELNSSSANNSNSWSGSEFTATTDSFTTGNSLKGNIAKNDVAENKRVGSTTSTATANNYSNTTENTKVRHNLMIHIHNNTIYILSLTFDCLCFFFFFLSNYLNSHLNLNNNIYLLIRSIIIFFM